MLWAIAEHFAKATFFDALLYFLVVLYPTSAGVPRQCLFSFPVCCYCFHRNSLERPSLRCCISSTNAWTTC